MSIEVLIFLVITLIFSAAASHAEPGSGVVSGRLIGDDVVGGGRVICGGCVGSTISVSLVRAGSVVGKANGR